MDAHGDRRRVRGSDDFPGHPPGAWGSPAPRAAAPRRRGRHSGGGRRSPVPRVDRSVALGVPRSPLGRFQGLASDPNAAGWSRLWPLDRPSWRHFGAREGVGGARVGRSRGRVAVSGSRSGILYGRPDDRRHRRRRGGAGNTRWGAAGLPDLRGRHHHRPLSPRRAGAGSGREVHLALGRLGADGHRTVVTRDCSGRRHSTRFAALRSAASAGMRFPGGSDARGLSRHLDRGAGQPGELLPPGPLVRPDCRGAPLRGVRGCSGADDRGGSVEPGTESCGARRPSRSRRRWQIGSHLLRRRGGDRRLPLLAERRWDAPARASPFRRGMEARAAGRRRCLSPRGLPFSRRRRAIRN